MGREDLEAGNKEEVSNKDIKAVAGEGVAEEGVAEDGDHGCSRDAVEILNARDYDTKETVLQLECPRIQAIRSSLVGSS